MKPVFVTFVTVTSHIRHHRRKLTGLVGKNQGGKFATQVKPIYLTVDKLLFICLQLKIVSMDITTTKKGSIKVSAAHLKNT